MEGLTAKQRNILEIIQKFIQQNGQSPTVREIAEIAGLRSSCTVQKHLDALERKGYIKKSHYKYRSIDLTGLGGFPQISRRMVNVPLVGNVAAGTPLLADENVEAVFPLPADIVDDRDLFMLRVQGSSMIDAGIHDGDFVVARRQSSAYDGDIVVALIEDEATVKRLFRENHKIRLQPENTAMKPIIVDDATILGKVVMAIKRF
ncbi:MAG: transcriptional repressor LexA [Armatimonadetes bacterium]|nr:transcriptional repressor LexA [Armatimonadota bacterium]